MLGKSIVVLLAPLFINKSYAESPHTFREAFAATIARSPDLVSARESLVQAEESQLQARFAFLPAFSTTLPVASDYSKWGTDSGVSTPTSQGKITAIQPLFRGLRDFAALSEAKAVSRQQSLKIEEAERQIYLGVADIYYSIVGLESDEEIYENEIAANQKRLKDLGGFLKIGKAQETDLLTFQANVSALEGQVENIRGQKAVFKQTLSYLTG